MAITSEPARFLGIDGDCDTIAVGKRADLVLLENPLEDPSNLWRQVGVMLHGRFFAKDELHRLLEQMAASYPSPSS